MSLTFGAHARSSSSFSDHLEEAKPTAYVELKVLLAEEQKKDGRPTGRPGVLCAVCVTLFLASAISAGGRVHQRDYDLDRQGSSSAVSSLPTWTLTATPSFSDRFGQFLKDAVQAALE